MTNKLTDYKVLQAYAEIASHSWVHASQDPPEPNLYIVHDELMEVCDVVYWNGSEWEHEYIDEKPVADITHWAPLPSYPKDREYKTCARMKMVSGEFVDGPEHSKEALIPYAVKAFAHALADPSFLDYLIDGWVDEGPDEGWHTNLPEDIEENLKDEIERRAPGSTDECWPHDMDEVRLSLKIPLMYPEAYNVTASCVHCTRHYLSYRAAWIWKEPEKRPSETIFCDECRDEVRFALDCQNRIDEGKRPIQRFFPKPSAKLWRNFLNAGHKGVWPRAWGEEPAEEEDK